MRASKTILVVDDDRDMVETLCDILELHGWHTLRAYDGQEAVSIAGAHDVDWILMDVRMPGLTGVEAWRAIRPIRPAARTVLMTAYASQDLVAQAEREGVTRVLRKPFDLPFLLELLQ
jgi:CheY-like chemotaxis protein